MENAKSNNSSNRDHSCDSENDAPAFPAGAREIEESIVNGESNDENQGSRRRSSRGRTPFTDLSQLDADLALARTLQEQERAYMMLTRNRNGIDYGSWEDGSYEDEGIDDIGDEEYDDMDADVVDDSEEDAFDVWSRAEASGYVNQGVQLDPSAFLSEEAYDRSPEDVEEGTMAARLFDSAGTNEMYAGEADDVEDHDDDSQDAWHEVDPDELSYEELLALAEAVGTESRGLSADTIASLPSVNYKSQVKQDGTIDSCVICRLDYEDGDPLTVLSCKHSYHPDCISHWLSINKVCPICNAEVSTPGKNYLS